MIDTKELRRLAQAAVPGPWKILPVGDGRQKFAVADRKSISILTVTDEGEATFGTVYDDADAKLIAAANPAAISELLDRLEAAEKERNELRSLVVMRFDHDHPPQFTQGYDTHELTEPVTAEHCRWFVAKIERLSAEVAHIKEVEFPRKAQAVADGWRGKCERLEAKIEAMEKQKPVAWLHETRRDSDVVTDAVKHVWGKVAVGSMAAYSIPLYTIPGAQPEPSVPTGWKLVPIDPTRNMLDIMDLGSNMLYRYRALLAAAPEAKL